MVKEFDPLDATLIGNTEVPASRETEAVSGLYAGRYQIEREVGRGGMGTVYRALDVMVGDVVALKVLDRSVIGGSDQMEWFRREVRLARRITHPNVARTHDMGEQAGAHYITMEFVEGTTLQDLLRAAVPAGEGEGEGKRRRVALEPARAARVALAVAEGLAAAHAAGVVHRDLKPANVLIERTGRVVLTDFGIARALSDEGAGARTMGVVGTPLYMAPEQLTGVAVDVRADVYALGLIVFEMLTGALPFAGETPIATALARLTQPAPDPRVNCPGLPAPLAELVLQCLAADAVHRPPTATAVAERLRGWLLAVSEPTTMYGAAGSDSDSGAAVSYSNLTPTQQQVVTSVVSGTMTQSGMTQSGTTQGGTRGGPGTTQQRPLRPLAPVPTAERALAVLPFRYIGPPDQSYLGDALTDELIDVLSRTRGMRVLGSGATAKYRNDRDPREVAKDLGVDAVVDATLQASPTQVRVAVRLVEVATGTQLWSDRFESGLEDVFELQDRISKRIAEALRVELSTAACSIDAPAEAIALYLRGRRQLLAYRMTGTDGAIELLEQAIALAPSFDQAIACHAVACLRAWFIPNSFVNDGAARDWEQEARDSVARALVDAPDLAETHLARAMLGAQLGEWRETVKALARALEIAPTYAHAHQYLAQLQCEAGNIKEGLERAKLAHDLEPSLVMSLFDIARLHALHGRREESERFLAMVDRNSRMRSAMIQFRLRVAGWFGDLQAVRDIIDDLQGDDADGFGRYVISYARALAGDFGKEELDVVTSELVKNAPSPRFYTLMCQNSVEIYASRGYQEDALRYFQRAADRVLIDMEWVDRCPLLASIRDLPGYAEARRKVRQRVQAMWSL